MKRGVLTSGTVVAIFGVYCAYAAIVAPLMQPDVPVTEQVQLASAPEIKPLSAAGRVANDHLTDHSWVASAKYQMQRGDESFIYFDKQNRIDDDKQNKMRVSPFALVWRDPEAPEVSAYTLSCESAVIEFESKVQLGNSSRIVGGQLDGAVQITGPDGLEIRGKDFLFSETALRLHSDHPVEFWYGPRPGELQQVHGRAEYIDVTLKDSAESLLGHDMPRISGLRQIALGKNVTLEMVMEDGGKPAPVLVSCKKRLIYDVGEQIATLVEDVRVRRRTGLSGESPTFDWIECDTMQLMFAERSRTAEAALAQSSASSGQVVTVSAESASRRRDVGPGLSLDLELQRLSAIGRQLKLGSDENHLTASMEQLYYDIESQTVEMRHTAGDVEASLRSDTLSCPFIRLRHDDDDQIDVAECLGAGRVFREEPKTQEVVMETSWSDHLFLRPDTEDDELDVLEIVGNGRILQPSQKTGVVADSLMVWLDRDSLQSADGDLQAAFREVAPGAGLPIRKVRAQTDVALVSPRLHLETQFLEAHYVAGKVAVPTRRESKSSSDESGLLRPDDRQQPIVVAADSVTTHLVIDPETEQADVLDLRASEGVTISRAGGPVNSDDRGTGDPFSIQAERLELRNQDGAHVLRLLGTPARILHPRAEIEGNELYLDRGGNLAMVEGAGALLVWVDSDLEGQPLEVPQKLIVRWADQMRFDGHQADFLGDVRTKLEASSMLCEEMMIRLDRRLSFADEDRAEAEELEIERIECHDGVTGEYIEWQRDASKLVGIRKIQVADFTFDCASGEFRAQGPGRIDDWQLGGQTRRMLLDPSASERESENENSKWEYTRVKFAGELNGNQRDRFVTLTDRVRVMHGPVERALEVIDRDEFSRDTSQAKNSVWIGSDVLQVRLVPGAEGDEDTASVLAKGNAELQGKVMTARADSISYDQSKEMFTLRGRGTEAYLWHQDRPGSPTREMSAKTIQFVPSRHEITIDGTRGIQGAQ